MNGADTLQELRSLFPNSPIEIFDRKSIKKARRYNRHAVYLICANSGEIAYIGYTCELHTRFSSSHNVWVNSEDSIMCLFFDTKEEALAVEKQLIGLFKPPRNKSIPDKHKPTALNVRVSKPFSQALQKSQWLMEKKVSDIVREAILKYWDEYLNEKEKKVIKGILGDAPELEKEDEELAK